MTLFKISLFILSYFLTRVAFASNCETFQGFNSTEKVCWHSASKGWISEKCLTAGKCEALTYSFKTKRETASAIRDGGYNPSSQICKQHDLDVIVLKDSKNNEESFCLFGDKSVLSTAAVSWKIK